MPIQGLTGFGGGATGLQYVSTATGEALKGSVRFDGTSGGNNGQGRRFCNHASS